MRLYSWGGDEPQCVEGRVWGVRGRSKGRAWSAALPSPFSRTHTQREEKRRGDSAWVFRPSDGVTDRDALGAGGEHRGDVAGVDAANRERRQGRFGTGLAHEIQAGEGGEILGARREGRADADVTGAVEHGPPDLLNRVGTDPDQRVRTEYPASLADRQILLSEMDAVRLH